MTPRSRPTLRASRKVKIAPSQQIVRNRDPAGIALHIIHLGMKWKDEGRQQCRVSDRMG